MWRGWRCVSTCFLRCVAVAEPYGQCGGSHSSGQASHPPTSVLLVDSVAESSQFVRGSSPPRSGGLDGSALVVVLVQHQEQHSTLPPRTHCHIDDTYVFGWVGCESVCHRRLFLSVRRVAPVLHGLLYELSRIGSSSSGSPQVFQASPPGYPADSVRQHHDSFLSDQAGGTHSALLCGLAWQIFQLAQILAVEIQVRHIPGKRNDLADSLSKRSPVQTEWALDIIVFQAEN